MFSKYRAYQKLQRLSPVDLTKEGVLTPKRLDTFLSEGIGLKLLYGTERVDEEILKTLFELAKEASAVEQMQNMQDGVVVNTSENRPALHTSTRDFFEGKKNEAAERAYAEVQKLKNFLQESDHFTDIVQIGIGGSDLGPRAIYYGLQAYQNPKRRAHFISNVDPDDAAELLAKVNLKTTLFVVVSKSGTTLETLTNEELVKERLKKAGLNPRDHIVAVTGEGSPMDNPSKYLRSFYIWDYVGGRYSATSMVGAVLLGFTLGMDNLMEFLKGASSMDKLAKNPDPVKNLPLLSALIGIWNRNFLKLPTCAIIPYSQALHRFTAHLQQLDMESNGKHIDKHGKMVDFATGPVIWGEPGTNGQHSFYQLIHQGTDVIPVEFIGFRQSQRGEDTVFQGTTCQEKLLANLFAQSIGLATGQKNANPNKIFEGNRPNSILLAEKLTPYTLGAILAYYEHKVAFQGFIWGINSFDQEGVQLGKVLALKIIDQYAAKRAGKAVDDKAFPLGSFFISCTAAPLSSSGSGLGEERKT